MIYDCFSFFNELDLLDIRLHELGDLVDKFVLVEATRTHSGKEKLLYYDTYKLGFPQFWHKIIHIIVDDMPLTREDCDAALTPQDRIWNGNGYQNSDNWIRERWQRNSILRGISNADPDDIIIIGDADEIVRPSVLETIEQTIVDGSNAVEQTLYSYHLNVKCVNVPWWGSKILRRKFVTNPSEHRFHTPAARFIYDGGWHFNFMGGADAVKQKIVSYAHDEFAVPEVLEKVGERLDKHLDVLGRTYEYAVVPIDETYPKYLQRNLQKFDHLIYKGQS